MVTQIFVEGFELDLTDDIAVDPDYKPKYTSIPGETYSDLYNSF